ncbi:hypothetical protein BN1708_020704, partial [Verticillium longisporum]
QWPLPAPNPPWPRCQVPRHGHHLRPDAEARGARRDRAHSRSNHQEGPRRQP